LLSIDCFSQSLGGKIGGLEFTPQQTGYDYKTDNNTVIPEQTETVFGQK